MASKRVRDNKSIDSQGGRKKPRFPTTFNPDVRSIKPLDPIFDPLKTAPSFKPLEFARAANAELAYVLAVFRNTMPEVYNHKIERLVIPCLSRFAPAILLLMLTFDVFVGSACAG